MPEASPTEGEASFYRSTLSALKWFAPKRWREVSLDAQALTFSTLLALVPTLTLLLWAFQHLGGFLHLRYNLEAELLELFSATPEVREVFGGPSWSRLPNILSEALSDLSLSSYLATRLSR